MIYSQSNDLMIIKKKFNRNLTSTRKFPKTQPKIPEVFTGFSKIIIFYQKQEILL
jgi:hypothetical protein